MRGRASVSSKGSTDAPSKSTNKARTRITLIALRPFRSPSLTITKMPCPTLFSCVWWSNLSRLRQVLAQKLQDDWSPQQIAGWLKCRHQNNGVMQIAERVVYQSSTHHRENPVLNLFAPATKFKYSCARNHKINRNRKRAHIIF